MTTGNSPQASFARFVRDAVEQSKGTRGWSFADVCRESGVGRSTLFRWMSGDWLEYPELGKVRGFCSALDLPLSVALRALMIPEREEASQPNARVERDIAVILDGLVDPGVTAKEKRYIREALHRLAARARRRTG
jgi:transcriptional regulator with XRE-family HTH domain